MAVEKVDVKGGSPEGRDTWLSTYPRSFPSRERRSLSEPVKTRTESGEGGVSLPRACAEKKLEERGSHLPFRHGLLRNGPVVPRDSVRAGVEALLFEVPGREGAGGGRDIEGWPKEKGGHGTRRSIDRSLAHLWSSSTSKPALPSPRIALVDPTSYTNTPLDSRSRSLETNCSFETVLGWRERVMGARAAAN